MSGRHRARKNANRKKAKNQGKTSSSSESIAPSSASSSSSPATGSSSSSSPPHAPGGGSLSRSTAPSPLVPDAATKIPYVATVYTHELGATERESGHCADLADLKRRINRMAASPIDAFRCYVPACTNGCRSMLSTVTGRPCDSDAGRGGGGGGGGDGRDGGGGGGGGDGDGDRKTERRMTSASATNGDAYTSYRVVSIPVCGLADSRHLQAHAILTALTSSRHHASYYDDEHCAGCLKTRPSPSMYACLRCARVRYCDVECARLAWPNHSGDCVPVGGGRSPHDRLSTDDDDRKTARSPPFPSASTARSDSTSGGSFSSSRTTAVSVSSPLPPPPPPPRL